MNPLYLPQLRAVLALPQSIGIVGGSPGRSVYFVGCQQDALIFLDPHQVGRRGGPVFFLYFFCSASCCDASQQDGLIFLVPHQVGGVAALLPSCLFVLFFSL